MKRCVVGVLLRHQFILFSSGVLCLCLLQLSSSKKEKDGEDRKRNPILKYIGKPRSTSQSSKYIYTHTLFVLI